MTDRYTVYTKVLKMLKQIITIGSRGHLVTLAMIIAGIVNGRNAQLSAMSSEIDVTAKEKSVEMRLRRWVKHSQPIGDYPLTKGQVFQRSPVGFTQSAVVSLNLVGWWSSRYEDPLYLVTNLSNGYQACKYYRRRFQIETFFSDQKSRGFHIHKSHMSDPLRLSHMLVAACLAYLWMVCQGLGVIAEKKTGLIDRKDRIDKSLFGWAWTGSSMH